MMNRHKQLPLAVSLPDDETFDSYVSTNNQLAKQHLQQFIALPLPANPTGLYLFGAAQVGKSHLLHASCSYATVMQKSSVCLSIAEINQLSVQVLEGLEQIDLVCLDDIHLIQRNQPWQRAIFDLFNRLNEHGKQLIVAGNVPALTLNMELADLQSRLTWGHTIQLKALSDDEKILAIQQRAKQRGLVLQQDVAKFIVNRFSRGMHDLIACLEQLDNASIQEQRKITIPFIKQVIKPVNRHTE